MLEIVLASAAFAVTAPLTGPIPDPECSGGGRNLGPSGSVPDGQYSDVALLVTAVLLLLGTVLVAPIVEGL